MAFSNVDSESALPDSGLQQACDQMWICQRGYRGRHVFKWCKYWPHEGVTIVYKHKKCLWALAGTYAPDNNSVKPSKRRKRKYQFWIYIFWATWFWSRNLICQSSSFLFLLCLEIAACSIIHSIDFHPLKTISNCQNVGNQSDCLYLNVYMQTWG